MKRVYQLCFLAILAPILVVAQGSLTLTSSSFYKSKPKNKTTLTIEVISKDKGKWVSTGGTAHYIPKPHQTLPLGSQTLLPANKDLTPVSVPDKIKIFSMPTSDNLQVRIDFPSPTFTIAVYDLIGKPIFKGNYKNIKDQDIFIPTEQLVSGLYFLKVESAGQTAVKSFTVL
jgi:hypothetical protein